MCDKENVFLFFVWFVDNCVKGCDKNCMFVYWKKKWLDNDIKIV